VNSGGEDPAKKATQLSKGGGEREREVLTVWGVLLYFIREQRGDRPGENRGTIKLGEESFQLVDFLLKGGVG